METRTLIIEGMSCGHCVAAVANALTPIDGIRVHDVVVGRVEVSYEPGSSALDDATSAIEQAGYAVARAAP